MAKLSSEILKAIAELGSSPLSREAMETSTRAAFASGIKAGDAIAPGFIAEAFPSLAPHVAAAIEANQTANSAVRDALKRYHGVSAEAPEIKELDQLNAALGDSALTSKAGLDQGVDPYLVKNPNIATVSELNEMGLIVRLQKVVGQAGTKLREIFSSEGRLAQYPAVARNIERMNARVNAEGSRIADITNRLQKEISVYTGGDETKHIGTVQAINEFLDGSRTLDQLPEALQPVVSEARDYITYQQMQALKLGAIPNNMVPKFVKSLGTYLHSQYRIFDDANFLAMAREGMTSESDDYVRAIKEVYRSNRTLYESQAAKLGFSTPEGVVEYGLNQSKKVVSDLLEKAQQVIESRSRHRGSLGQRLTADVDTLLTKEELTPAVKAFIGEYRDPLVRFSMSAAKLNDLTAHYAFLNRIAKEGAGKVFFDAPTQRATVKLFDVNDTSESAKYLSSAPLANKYMTPELQKAVLESIRPDKDTSLFTGALRGFASVVNRTLTTYNPDSMIRNIPAAFTTVWNSGNFIWSSQERAFGKNFMATLKASLGDVSKSISGAAELSDDVSRGIFEAKSLGVFDENVDLNGVIKAVKGVGDAKTVDDAIAGATENYLGAAKKLLKRVDAVPSAMYQLPDNMGRYFTYLRELERYSAATGVSASNRALKEYAAGLARDIHPTYSRSLAFTKFFKDVPAFGMFVMYPTEIYRTTANALRVGVQELKNANPAIRQIGFRRIMSVTAGHAVTAAAPLAVSKLWNGVTPEEQQNLRHLLPDYQKDSTLIFSRDGDKYKVKDVSFVYPQTYIQDPFHAAMNAFDNEKSIIDAVMGGFSKFMQPYMEGREGTARLAAAYVNRDPDTGLKIVADDAPFNEQLTARFNYVFGFMNMPVVRKADRLLKAINKEPLAMGRIPDLGEEMTAPLLGRTVSLDPFRLIGQKAKMYRENKDVYDKSMVSALASGGKLPYGTTDGDVYENYLEAVFRQQAGFAKEVEAVKRLGLPPGKLRESLKQRGLSKQEIDNAIMGVFVPPIPSKRLLETARSNGRPIDMTEINEVRTKWNRKPLLKD